jgi:hypothetical protein
MEVQDPDTAAETIQSDLNNIRTWSEDWLVAFSPAKTKEMVISLKVNKPIHPTINFGDQAIARVAEHKHLGVTFTEDLKWNTHTMQTAKKACKKLNILRPLKFLLDKKTLELLYFTYVRSQLEYGDIVWDNCNLHDRSLDILETVQVSAARLVTGAIARSSVTKLYRELNWAPLAKRRENHRLVQFYKIWNNLAPEYLLDLMPAQVLNRTIYQLRNRMNIDVPAARLNRYLYSFYPATIRIWNTLPEQTKMAPDRKSVV